MMVAVLIAFFGLVAIVFFFFQAEDGIRDKLVTGVQTCVLPISPRIGGPARAGRTPARAGHRRRGPARRDPGGTARGDRRTGSTRPPGCRARGPPGRRRSRRGGARRSALPRWWGGCA